MPGHTNKLQAVTYNYLQYITHTHTHAHARTRTGGLGSGYWGLDTGYYWYSDLYRGHLISLDGVDLYSNVPNYITTIQYPRTLLRRGYGRVQQPASSLADIDGDLAILNHFLLQH